ncbi:MAG: hypothetical protein ABIM99_00430 [Candidatus Dojkabacteria bacterium]
MNEINSILDNGSKLGNILKQKLNSLKGDKLGENYIYWIDNSKFDTPDDSYKLLKDFITKCKSAMLVEADFYRTYSPLVFHENTFKNIEQGLELYNQIEKEL